MFEAFIATNRLAHHHLLSLGTPWCSQGLTSRNQFLVVWLKILLQ